MKIELNAKFDLDKDWINENDPEEVEWFIIKALPNAILILFDQEHAGDSIAELKPGEFTYKIEK